MAAMFLHLLQVGRSREQRSYANQERPRLVSALTIDFTRYSLGLEGVKWRIHLPSVYDSVDRLV